MTLLPDRMKRLARCAVAGMLAALSAITFPACGEVDARIAVAQEFSAAGDFDQAFEAFERLYQTGVRDPRVLSGLGLVLTLQPASLFAGMDMLEASLEARADEGVREQLMLLYLALGRVDQARELIHPDRLSVEQVYSPGITRMRLGLGCLHRPGARPLKRLQELPPHPRRDFFEILCGFAISERRARVRGTRSRAEMIAAWRTFREREALAACEALAVLPWPTAASSSNSSEAAPGAAGDAESESGTDAFPHGELRACRSGFPGEISIQRERPGPALRDAAANRAGNVPGAGDGPGRSLFGVDLFEPGDPGAELEKAPYRRPPASEPAAGDGPYLPLP